jgi:hypothetical protein
MDAHQLSPIICNSLDCPEARIERKDRKSILSEPVDYQWLQTYYHSLPCPPFGNKRPIEDYQDAYLFGSRARSQNKGPFLEVHDILEEAWNDLIGPSVLEWEDAEPIIQYAYTRGAIRYPRRLKLARQVAA